MLILTRRPSQVIEIGDNIRVHVRGIRGDQVQIGVEAPKDVVVHRSEIADRIREGKKQGE